MNHLGTKRLETERLILRRFVMEDAQPMFDNWANDPQVVKYLTWPCHGDVEVTGRLLESWIANYENENYYQWAIEFEGRLIGSICAVECDDKAELVEIGYCIGRPWWHRGITSEALCAVMKFFFEEVGANHVTARHDPQNPHSGGVMKKCGMRHEGTLRQYARNNQGICDIACYGMLRSEWEANDS